MFGLGSESASEPEEDGDDHYLETSLGEPDFSVGSILRGDKEELARLETVMELAYEEGWEIEGVGTIQRDVDVEPREDIGRSILSEGYVEAALETLYSAWIQSGEDETRDFVEDLIERYEFGELVEEVGEPSEDVSKIGGDHNYGVFFQYDEERQKALIDRYEPEDLRRIYEISVRASGSSCGEALERLAEEDRETVETMMQFPDLAQKVPEDLEEHGLERLAEELRENY